MYPDFTDEALAHLASGGEEGALDEIYTRYKLVLRGKANQYFLVGGDREDLIQEGMIGLFRAIMDYDDEGGASFSTYAEICINRQMQNAVRRDSRMKHSPLNTSVSLTSAKQGEEDKSSPSAEDIALTRDSFLSIEKDRRKMFSPLEYEVWELLSEGANYREIASHLNRTPKTIDNAIQRIKKKLESNL